MGENRKFNSAVLSVVILAGVFGTYHVFPPYGPVHWPFRRLTPWNALSLTSPLLSTASQLLNANDSSLSLVDPTTDLTLALRCQDLYSWICHQKDETNDLTGTVNSDIVGEKQAAGIYQKLVKQHPDWTVETIDEVLVKEIYTDKRRARVKSAFQWTKQSLKEFFNKQEGFSLREKTKIMALLNQVELQLPPPASIYNDEPDLFTKGEVYYERTQDGKLRLRVGGAYLLTVKSWFNLVFTLAHELAHAVDPCEIHHYNYSFSAYKKLTSCFIRNGMVEASRNRTECGAHDQLSESFADWIAAHVIANTLRFYSTEFSEDQILNAARNSIRDLCSQDDDASELDIELHPSPKVRIGKIFGQNPEVRYQLGCTEFTSYCTFEP